MNMGPGEGREGGNRTGPESRNNCDLQTNPQYAYLSRSSVRESVNFIYIVRKWEKNPWA